MTQEYHYQICGSFVYKTNHTPSSKEFEAFIKVLREELVSKGVTGNGFDFSFSGIEVKQESNKP